MPSQSAQERRKRLVKQCGSFEKMPTNDRQAFLRKVFTTRDGVATQHHYPNVGPLLFLLSGAGERRMIDAWYTDGPATRARETYRNAQQMSGTGCLKFDRWENALQLQESRTPNVEPPYHHDMTDNANQHHENKTESQKMPASTRLNEAQKGSEKHDAGISNPPAQYEESDSDSEITLNPVMSDCGLPVGYNFSKSVGRNTVSEDQEHTASSDPNFHPAEFNPASESRPSTVASRSSADPCGLPVGYNFYAPLNQ